MSQFRRHFRCSHADQITGTIHGFRLSGLGKAAADIGQAARIGPLSVPQSWTSMAPIAATASVLRDNGLATSSAIGTSGPASMLGGMPLGAPTTNRLASAPKYGFRPTVVPRPPIGG
ncbi:PE/PPE C-terminal domain-containing protein [Mycobacterium xenopi]|uniref:PE/PPE C-terminal domain-containing protein n=1 Tax=Mycobacterium xenopi TaxID=1789 RepID=UPI000A154A73